jgi:hypothetical protein
MNVKPKQMNVKKILNAETVLVLINVFVKKDLKETNCFAMVNIQIILRSFNIHIMF